ncbi:MAG: DUF167 domain-containing protein [Novosphingobium sp.]|nr:DUF167 domain-containing protein [Novosphingobium sp.]
MARPKADWPEAAAIRALIDAEGRLALKATPGAKVETVEIAGGRLLVKVHARATDGQANHAVIACLARALDVPRSRISLLRGATSREKLVRVES